MLSRWSATIALLGERSSPWHFKCTTNALRNGLKIDIAFRPGTATLDNSNSECTSRIFSRCFPPVRWDTDICKVTMTKCSHNFVVLDEATGWQFRSFCPALRERREGHSDGDLHGGVPRPRCRISPTRKVT